MSLPLLTDAPIRLPGLCLSVSSRLLTCLITHLPDTPCRVISIGCGTGLLEALLHEFVLSRHKSKAEYAGIIIQGVEVRSATVSPRAVQYLHGEALHVVKGTWQILPDAARFNVWMWVYPREPKLLKSYLQNNRMLLSSSQCLEQTTDIAASTGAMLDGSYMATSLSTIVWLGPCVDWPYFAPVFDDSVFSRYEYGYGSQVGLREEEMLVVIRKVAR